MGVHFPPFLGATTDSLEINISIKWKGSILKPEASKLYIRAKFSQIIRMKYSNWEYNYYKILQTSTDILKRKSTCYCKPLCDEVVWGTPRVIRYPFHFPISTLHLPSLTAPKVRHSIPCRVRSWFDCTPASCQCTREKILVLKQPNGGICFFEAAMHSSQLPMRNRLLFSRVSRHNVRFFEVAFPRKIFCQDLAFWLPQYWEQNSIFVSIWF